MEILATDFVNTWWAILPPIIAIALALITKEAYTSLFIGVVLGALLIANFNVIEAFDHIINDGFISSIANNAGIFIFLVLLGAIVAIINSSGGSYAFGRWASKKIKSKQGTMIATFVLGILIFIDDYFNCLTVGSVMKPVTDRHKISRTKLAYLIDATAAPVCIIAPLSSWAAAVSGIASDMGNTSGITLFIQAIPYNFYSFLTFAFIISIIILNFDYGPMKKFDELASNGNIGAIDKNDINDKNKNGKVIDIVIPVVVLIILCTFAMLRTGGFFDSNSEYYLDLIGAFGNSNSFSALPWGGLITLIFTIFFFICRRTVSFKKSISCLTKGFSTMIAPMLILVLALSLKSMTSMLGIDVFIQNTVQNLVGENFYSFIPAIIFLISCLFAFASGSSWGTFGILIPIVLAVFTPDNPLCVVGISACLAGSVCGDHCSPISDTTIMASAGAGCLHINHVSTQLPYVIVVACVSFIMYILTGFINNPALWLFVGIATIFATLFTIKMFVSKRSTVRK